ncbi:hypothetical protein Droror1_Dr00014487 [Drosera rotundifolia]
MFKLLWVTGLRSIWMVFDAWMQLVNAVIRTNMEVCWSFITGAICIVTLPARALGALHREKLMERLLLEMNNELETMLWSKKELETCLQVAMKEQELMDVIATELEEQHEKAIVKIELLEDEVQKLKAENLRLQEIHGKGFYEVGYHKTFDTRVDYASSGTSSWKWVDEGSKLAVKDVLASKDFSETMTGTKITSKLSLPLDPGRMSNFNLGEVAAEQKEVALYRSLFSTILSLAVGLVIWKAQDPCVPLVMALFAVVSMSLKSVIQFFSTIESKGGLDAIVLLSLNWFILGILAYPTLPRLASVFLQPASQFLDRTLAYFALQSLYH